MALLDPITHPVLSLIFKQLCHPVLTENPAKPTGHRLEPLVALHVGDGSSVAHTLGMTVFRLRYRCYLLSGGLYSSIFSLLGTHSPSYLGITFGVLMPGNTVPVNVRWKMGKLAKNAVKKLFKHLISACFYSTYVYFDRLAAQSGNETCTNYII